VFNLSPGLLPLDSATSTEGSPSHPLQLGQVLYAIQDTTLIHVPHGSSVACHQRVTFAGNGNEPQAVVNDRIDLGDLADIRSARAVTHWGSGKQEVALLTKSGLSYIAREGQTSRQTTVPAKVDDAVLVLGLDPMQPEKHLLALLVTEGSGFAIVLVDLSTTGGGARSKPWRLPPKVQGRAVAAEMVRRGLSATLMVATVVGGSLQVHAVAWKDLAPDVSATVVETVALGNVSADSSAQVAVAVTRMVVGSIDQQLAVAWTDGAGAGKIAVIGWKAEGQAAVLATNSLQFTFASPDMPLYRLVAADLMQTGVEQLILGYPATYGKNKKVKGCAAFMLFTLDEKIASLKCVSNYAVANIGEQPLASYDLHLGAGLFGTCMGVQVVGLGASLGELVKGQAHVRFGFVTVDPRQGFPRMPADESVPSICVGTGGNGNVLATIAADAPRFLAFPSDLTGRSVILGPPTFDVKSRCGQIVAFIQAPPYDRRTKNTEPSLSFSQTTGKVEGLTVSNDKSLTTSTDFSLNFGLGSLLGSRSWHDSYMESFDKSNDRSSSFSVQFHGNLSDSDFLLVYEISYNVWRYPVVSTSSEALVGGDRNKMMGGEVLAIFPKDRVPSLNWVPAHSYGYRPRSEVGMLFSYADLRTGPIDPKNLLFEGQLSTTVTAGQDVSTITFDKSNMTTITESQHFSVVNSVTDHVNWTAEGELFEWLPVNFGLNLGTSHSYSDSKVTTTHLTIHDAISLSVSSGTVEDVQYEYRITPIIYWHDKLGCLMVTWDVDLCGNGWKPGPGGDRMLTAPQICLIRPITKSKNLLLTAFSRSISFVEKKEGTVDISVEIFNNSPTEAHDVSCELFLGKPVKDKESPSGLGPPEESLGKVQLDRKGVLGPLERRQATLAGQRLAAKPIYISVRLYIGQMCMPQIYWGVYPRENSPE
jgi:hypothetical protein